MGKNSFWSVQGDPAIPESWVCLARELDYEGRRAWAKAYAEEHGSEALQALNIKLKPVGWEPGPALEREARNKRPRTTFTGHLRRDPTHVDGNRDPRCKEHQGMHEHGGVKITIKCMNPDLDVAHADIAEVVRVLRHGRGYWTYTNGGHVAIGNFFPSDEADTVKRLKRQLAAAKGQITRLRKQLEGEGQSAKA